MPMRKVKYSPSARLSFFGVEAGNAHAVEVHGVLLGGDVDEQPILRVDVAPPVRIVDAPPPAEVPGGCVGAQLLAVQPEGDVRAPVVVVVGHLRTQFAADAQRLQRLAQLQAAVGHPVLQHAARDPQDLRAHARPGEEYIGRIEFADDAPFARHAAGRQNLGVEVTADGQAEDVLVQHGPPVHHQVEHHAVRLTRDDMFLSAGGGVLDDAHQPRFLQDVDVEVHRGDGHVQFARDARHAEGAAAEQAQDLHAQPVAEGGGDRLKVILSAVPQPEPQSSAAVCGAWCAVIRLLIQNTPPYCCGFTRGNCVNVRFAKVARVPSV